MMATHRKVTLVLLAALGLWLPRSPATAAEAHRNLTRPLNSGREVTRSCLACHPGAGQDLLHSSHWTWIRPRVIDGQKEAYSKLEGLTTFAISASGNPTHCLGCHISQNPAGVWENDMESIDCLVCHDTTGSYRRGQDNDYLFLARNAGRPEPRNCTTCHGRDCGLTDSISQGASRITEDIHLASERISFTCQSCHQTKGQHRFQRVPIKDLKATAKGCQACHGQAPHQLTRLNEHGRKISCKTCHIPSFGRTAPAPVTWNWVMGNRADTISRLLIDGQRDITLDRNGFTLTRNIEPQYLWSDGSELLYRRGTRIRPEHLTAIQQPAQRSPQAKITPFSAVYATQLYDVRYRYLISPQLADTPTRLFSEKPWDDTAREGMNSIRLPYSGTFGYTTTVTYRTLSHGVAPANQALDCLDCHGQNGRMDWQRLGYDQDPWNDTVKQDTTGEEPGDR
ncbi:hypothetical protein [Desulfolithobacter sp.]